MIAAAAPAQDVGPQSGTSLELAVSAARTPELSDVQSLEAFVDVTMPHELEQDHIAGAAISIVKHGEILFIKGYGYADLAARRPVDPARTVFRIGSVSKLFVGIAVLLMGITPTSRLMRVLVLTSFQTIEL